MPPSSRLIALTLLRSSRRSTAQSKQLILACQEIHYQKTRSTRRAFTNSAPQSLFTSSKKDETPENPAAKPSTSNSTAADRSSIATAPSGRTQSAAVAKPGTATLSNGFSDQPIKLAEDDPSQVDWTSSFHGLSTQPFSKEAADILLSPLTADDVEIKPDGIIYLPEIKYRRILNRAFGPGGWGLAPRGESIVTNKSVTREYALLAHGRLVSIARGEQDYFSPEGIPTAAEGCKSNAMMRCCKDLGVASELWDPRYIRKFKAEHTREVFVEHAVTKKRTKIWVRKGDPIGYPWKETKFGT